MMYMQCTCRIGHMCTQELFAVAFSMHAPPVKMRLRGCGDNNVVTTYIQQRFSSQLHPCMSM